MNFYNRIKYFFKQLLFIFIFSIILCNCRQFIKRPSNRIQAKYISWQFKLQPFEGATIYFDQASVKTSKIYQDKTLATLKVKVPLYKDRLGFLLKIKKKGFQTFQKDIFLLKQHKHWLKKSPTFILNPINSSHKFHSYHLVGKQPKSVTFLNEQVVVIPLLNDNGIDVLDIFTGKRIRMIPPKKYARHGGFVESLVLKNKNELWVSQMSTNSLHVFDLTNFQYKTSIKLSAPWVKVMGYHKKRKLIYASNWLGRNISVVEPMLYKEIKTISIEGVPRGFWLHPNTHEIFIAQFGDKNDTDQKGKVLKINLQSGKILRKMGKPGAKRHIVYSNFTQKMYVSDMKRSVIESYDIDRGIQVESFRTHPKPNTIALDPSHRYLYVSCRGPNSSLGYRKKGNIFGRIDVIDLKKNKLIESIEGGNQPTGLDISPNGRYLVFSDFLDHAIRVYERLNN